MKKINSKVICSHLLIFILSSCAQNHVIGDLVLFDQRASLDKNQLLLDVNSIESLQNQINGFGSFKRFENQKKFYELLKAFDDLRANLRLGKVSVAPRSSMRLEVVSFCLSHDKAIPEPNEVFRWVMGSPNVPYSKEALMLYSKLNTSNQDDFQELFWNLSNKTYYENYPEKQKKILNDISSAVKFSISSEVRNNIVNEVLPNKLKEGLEFIEGQYYSYQKIRSLIDLRKSSQSPTKLFFASRIPETGLSVSSKSNGFSSQILTFYNPSNQAEAISLANYYMQPMRTDVQIILLASVLPNFGELQKVLDEWALKILGNMGSQYPTLTPSERELVKQKPTSAFKAFFNMISAERESEKRFPDSTKNGPADAFRHFVWAAMLSRDLGEDEARKFLGAHETLVGQPIAEKEMDQFNNDRGILSSKDLLKTRKFSDYEIFDLAAIEIKNGKLKILNFERRKNSDY